jgi:uncharacterized damage-inducible protein DinB
MSYQAPSLDTVFQGWDEYQQNLITAVAPLTPEQLTLRAAPHLRSVGELVAHIVSTRVRWFHAGLGVGGAEVERFLAWGQADGPVLGASDLVDGLRATWEMIHDALKAWDVSDLAQDVKSLYRGKTYLMPRQFVIWHVIEHDLHHGGELFVTLGILRLPTPDVGVVAGHIKEA